jgi:signal transduction histidine kinase
MRLSLRMTFTTALAGLALFGIYGAWLVHEERADLRRSVERELTFLGTSLRVGVENAIRDRQLADVEEVTLRLEGIDTKVDVFVFDTSGAPVVAPTGVPQGALRHAIDALVHSSATSSETKVSYFPEDLPTTLLLATPLLSDDGEPLGALAIARPLDDMNEDLLQTVGSVAATVGMFVLLAIVLGLYVGNTRLARPAQRLVSSMGRVQSGALHAQVPETGDDELVAIAHEFNQMLGRLEAAERAITVEVDARREATRSLEAADRLGTLGQLAASLAHEIGSPLQVVLGRARALVEHPEEPARVRQVAGVLVREAERITRIVDQLLALTRRPPARREPVELRLLVRDVVALLEIEARRKRVHLSIEDGDEVEIDGDPDRLRQVVLNLVRNALAAVAQGGEVVVHVESDASGARVRVVDDGTGMAPEVRERVFEPLFTTRAAEGGTGLGLAVVQGIVREHRGTVVVTSVPGQGSSFVVTLPLEERP